MFFFRGRGASCQHPFPTPMSQVHFCFTAYQPDWVKIKKLYLFPCGGRQ